MDRVSPGSHSGLVGRDRELAILNGCLTAAQGGRGSLVLISGEAGIGKTALTNSFTHAATNARLTVLTGHCYDRTETPPYGPWREIGQRVDAIPVPRIDDATSQADLFTQARDFLAAMTAERPLVLVLEDLHWADNASLDLLRFLARGFGDLPLLCVATYRDDEVERHHPLAGLVPLLVREAPTERLSLRPLNTSAAQALVRARYDFAEPASERLAMYLIERTEGNALFMTELLRSLEEDRLLERVVSDPHAWSLAPTPVPSLLQQIVDDRLNRLGDEAAALLAIAAVVGQEVPIAVWESVSRVDEETLLTTTERAEAAHLVTVSTSGDGIRFTHALIHDVLYEHVPALRRRRLHRQVGEALIALSAPDPDAVAYHFQQAGDERAAGWLVRAGERAEDAYALVTSAKRYEAAFRLLDTQGGDAAERGWLRLLAAAQRRHDDWDQAFVWVQEAAQLAATAGDHSLTARAQALLGLLIDYRGDYSTAVATMAGAADMIDLLTPGTGTARRREQQIDKAVNRSTLIGCLAHGGRLTEARTQGESYVATVTASANSPGAPGTIADAHYGLALAYAYQGEPVLARRSYAAAVAADHASDNHMLALVRKREELILVVLPYQADDLAERERAVAAAEETAAWVVARGGHANPDLPRYARFPLLVLEGEWGEARRILDSPNTSDLAFTSRVRAFYRGTLARAQGETETAWRCVREPWVHSPDAEPGEQFGSLPLRYQLLAARLALDAGDLDAARRWLDLHRRWLDFMDATLERAEGEVVEAEWHRAAGDVARARFHADRAMVYAIAPRQPLALLAAHRMLGILATDAGRIVEAEQHFAQALALADACRAPYERALILVAHAELLVTTSAHHRTRAMLDEAKTLCLPLGAQPALAQIEQLVARLAGTSDGPPVGLSEREVDVLRLLAIGLSNREIADQLYLSPNTVKVHVTNIFAKLDVHNRVAATEFALRHGIA